MRGFLAMFSGVAAVVIVAIMSRSVSRQSVYSARTSRRVLQRMVESCKRSLEQSDRSATMNVAHYATARTWAEAALFLASEESIKNITGADLPHLMDRSQRKLDASVRDVNRTLPRSSRIPVDRVLIS